MKGGPWPYAQYDIPSDWYEVAVGPKDDPESALNDCGVIKNVAQKIQKYLERFIPGYEWSWHKVGSHNNWKVIFVLTRSCPPEIVEIIADECGLGIKIRP